MYLWGRWLWLTAELLTFLLRGWALSDRRSRAQLSEYGKYPLDSTAPSTALENTDISLGAVVKSKGFQHNAAQLTQR